MQAVCLILGTVSLAMGIMNIFTHKTVLMIATMTFAAVCYINFGILRFFKRSNLASDLIFSISIIILFSYFLLTGGTAGFSPHWILMLPACGFIIFGIKKGSLLSGLMFLIVAFFLWIPVGKSLLMYDYTPEYCMRFPMVYLGFFAVGFFFELIRSATYDTMVETQDQLEVIAQTDTLTKIPNRYWFNLIVNRDYANRKAENDGVMLIMDIDNFKSVNDIYGHAVGDLTLVKVSNTIRHQFREKDLFCRWGGEEFFAYLPACESAAVPDVCDRICKKVRQTQIEYEPGKILTVSISVGAVLVPAGVNVDTERLFAEADRQLYLAKERGKDRYVIEYSSIASR